MADYYQQTSFQFKLVSKEAADWLEKTWNKYNENNKDNCVPADLEIEHTEDNYLAWIHIDESGDLNQVADKIQAYLKKYNPLGIVTFEWADTCSKPRLNSFAGGACVVTADDSTFMHTGTWIANEIKDLIMAGGKPLNKE